MDWKDKALELSGTMNDREIVRALNLEDTIHNYNIVHSFLKRHRNGKIVVKKADKPQKFETLENYTPKEYKEKWEGDTIRFGLVSDTHINGKYTQLTYLHQFYEKCAEEGITTIYHAGDIDDGDQMRQGHQYEVYHAGADEHVEEIVKNYPYIDGITTKFITGNHDASIYRRAGFNIGKAIAEKREDMVYLGRDCAVINLTPNCTLELRHPWDGSSYALSYRAQKIVEAMEGGSKPNLLAIGHYHKQMYFMYRNVHVFLPGCFQSQTPFERGKALSAQMGGWIVEIKVDKKGYIQEITPKFIPFYVPIQNDWRRWR